MFTKSLKKERKKKERRTKQSLDSPQTIEANNNRYDTDWFFHNIFLILFKTFFPYLLLEWPFSGCFRFIELELVEAMMKKIIS